MVAAEKAEWVKMKPHEAEAIILDLHKSGNSPEKIGIILRDKHGIPKAKLLLGKRISKVLEEKKLAIPSEKSQVQGKISILEKHIAKNKHDHPAKRSLTKKLWIVKKLS